MIGAGSHPTSPAAEAPSFSFFGSSFFLPMLHLYGPQCWGYVGDWFPQDPDGGQFAHPPAGALQSWPSCAILEACWGILSPLLTSTNRSSPFFPFGGTFILHVWGLSVPPNVLNSQSFFLYFIYVKCTVTLLFIYIFHG